MNKEFIYNNLADPAIPIPSGLFTGKTGICLYLYHAGYTNKAYEWMQAANEELTAMKGNITVEEGLCGTGLVISHLIQRGYINGNINTVLQEIDDRVFQQMAYNQTVKGFKLMQLIHILYYLVVRWKVQEDKSDSEYLFRSLITKVMNDIYERIEPQSISEPLHYSLDYALPQVLFIMDYLLSLNLNRRRIERMMEELSPIILSTIPQIQANRLYLLCGIDSLLAHGVFRENWKQYRSMLFNNIDVDYILTKEMGCKSIYIDNGVSSLYFLLKRTNGYSEKMNEYRERIMASIDNSPEWKVLAENKAYLRSHLGLYNGICGTALAYSLMELDKQKGGK